MNPAKIFALERLIATAIGAPAVKIRSRQSCSGGCIHHADIVELDNGSRYFVKSSEDAAEMFAREVDGLQAFTDAGILRVPLVLTYGQLDNNCDCLVLEAVDTGSATNSFWEVFGRGLAEVHQRVTAQNFGWPHDNFIGSNLQRNAPTNDWVQFFAEQRLGYQLHLARQKAVGSRELFKVTERLISRLGKWIAHPVDPPSLLHGDLWSGNYLVDDRGAPAIFDPAVYFGRREADLAMTMLFGGFPESFFAAYDEFWPLEAGWQERVKIYQLYHLLNHLNMFGSGYLDSCLEVARRFAG